MGVCGGAESPCAVTLTAEEQHRVVDMWNCYIGKGETSMLKKVRFGEARGE